MSDPSASKSADKKSEDANGAGPSNTTENAAAKPALEQLGALEEDDEFEEFPVEDWPQEATTLAALTGGAAGKDVGVDPSQQLWEDNWDDDDVEVAFTAQLRAELKSQNDPDAMKS